MQSPKYAALFGFLAWLVWMPTIMILMMFIPKDYTIGASIPIVLLLASILTFALLYLRKVGQGSWREGVYVGLLWAVIFAIFDIGHYIVMGAFSASIYFAAQFPIYLSAPIMLGLLFHFVRSKTTENTESTRT